MEPQIHTCGSVHLTYSWTLSKTVRFGRLRLCRGNGRRRNVKYGCPSHRHRGACENAIMIPLFEDIRVPQFEHVHLYRTYQAETP